jgi:outer membrane protein TolC
MNRTALFAPLLLAACAAPQWHEDLDRLRDIAAAVPVESESVHRLPSTDDELDRVLAGPLDLATLIPIARARNPELREASARTRSAVEGVALARSLDEPMFKIESEGIPFHHPAAVDQAVDNKIGLTQTFPFPGNVSLRAEAATRDAEGIYQRYRDRDRDVILRLKKAWLDYYAAVRAIETHDVHLQLMEATEKISDAKFRTGAVTQQDVLKPQIEQVMLHNEVQTMEQMKGSARAAINQILHRPADAPLGEPAEIVLPDETFDYADLLARAERMRPDLKAAELQVKSTQAALRLAERQRDLPDFSLGVDYMQMPNAPDGYSAMFSINLPWFTGKKSAEARRLEQTLRADEAALDTVRGRAQFEIRDALLRVQAARRSAALFRNELVPKSAQTVEVSRTAYEKDKSSFLELLDAERSLRDVRLKSIIAMTQYEGAVADLEKAVGEDLRRKP